MAARPSRVPRLHDRTDRAAVARVEAAGLDQANTTGAIPFPVGGEPVLGGHAVVAAGFDDNKVIRNANAGGITTKGALLIRNSWGTSWGQAGYGWLPYQFVLSGLAVDWWNLVKHEWVETGQFGVALTLGGMAAAEYGVEARR